MPFEAYCDFCDYQHHCEDGVLGTAMNCQQCGRSFVAEPGKSDVDSLRSYRPKLRRKRKAQPEADQLGSIEKADLPSQWQKTISLSLAIAGFSIAVAAAIYGRLINPQSAWLMYRWVIVSVSVGGWFLLDWHYRRQIQAEIEHYGGEVKSIRWQPLQGMIGTRGYSWNWRRQNLKFYQVRYVDRDGNEKSDLCGISILLGSDWDW